uniref:2-deoxy-scyllo-inosose synthase n=1 Tax=Streptomyces ribosidificus TaxID=80859 RepID=DOIS_STRRI|nr:RecName: Full=2-deoxy-scyllo-inosose synthase; Short=DOI synthase; Short=DOIS [Streptomyces ribosidificus]CAG34037.1 putative 2-deoxy-scyllo-inosose synthase/cyclase [Streptomyces ribosidificus]CAG34718.1 2-deoxy-scyllo-inosose synthase [Streptomyces ribosidificus]
MQVTPIAMEDASFAYRLGTECTEDVVARLATLGASSYLVVADTTVAGLYGHDLTARIDKEAGPAHLLTHESGEVHKDLTTVSVLAEQALERGADRRSVVVALGGGVTGNITGLMASLLFRGIRLVHVPTTVVAMLDSVLSLKQAVNATFGKNLVGTFYQPVEVLADTAFLRTLPPREIRSGLGEVVKNALAIRPAMLDRLGDALRADARYDDETLRWIIAESLTAKADVTRDDKHERRTGLVLEYGHTAGHAIEHASRGEVAHGAGVAVGMTIAAEVSRRLGHAGPDFVALHRELVAAAGVEPAVPAHVDPALVKNWLAYDNKRGYLDSPPGHTPMVLLSAPGEVLHTGPMPLVPVPLALLEEAVDEAARRGRDAAPAAAYVGPPAAGPLP